MAEMRVRQPLHAPHRGIAGSAVDVSAQQAHLLVKKNDHLPKTSLKMKRLLSRLIASAERHARYRRTRNEIAHLSPRLCRDLGISPKDADHLAHHAVYGH
ncbi:uncharacterized protein DUF1127 [Rhodobacter viridis]|uniref:Uncharacterized protein DUF1127 n=1 Tax=Rhodobacter viridis TaxID=1054202 RepID=A0A318TY21_9RHOB|nr:DUF1127 domain-containing protein [Rhodobacter viridis]PYF09936.1 uncharacterized protein DUF1127 [Rhodobacter viridis]